MFFGFLEDLEENNMWYTNVPRGPPETAFELCHFDMEPAHACTCMCMYLYIVRILKYLFCAESALLLWL